MMQTYKLKLIKGMSYTGHGVRATRQQPYVTIDEAAAEKLVASGFFELVGSQKTETTEKPKTVEEKYADEIAVENMNFAQLKSVAAQMGITTKGLKSKADYIAAIKESAEAADAAMQE